MTMDQFTDQRDRALLDKDRYTFFVLRRIIEGDCTLLLSDHEKGIICYSGPPYPVWIWTSDDILTEKMEKIYRLIEEHGLLDGNCHFNLKYGAAQYLIQRAAADGKQLSIQMNMLAYDCMDPIKPKKTADGGIHRCVPEDLEALTEFYAQFHKEIGIDEKGYDAYRADAQADIDTGNMFLWRNAQNKNVACCKYRPNGALASIGLVFTQPEYRRMHYAANLVYQVTAIIKAAGFIPMLYTDADYTASNACYEKIGYVPRGKLCTIG